MIPAEAVAAARERSHRSHTWLWWFVALLPVTPFVLLGLWLFATNDAVMFTIIVAALVGICVGGTIYAKGGKK